MIDRREVCIGSLAALCGARLGATRRGQSNLFLFADPDPGNDAAFAHWWSEQLSDLRRFASSAKVAGYRRSPVRLRAGAEPLPMHMAIVDTSSLGTVRAPVERFMAAIPAGGGALTRRYSVRYDIVASWPGGSTLGGSRYLQIVLSDAVAGQSGEYERWYAAHHGPELAAVRGVTGIAFGRRGDLPPSLRYGREAPTYLSAMRFQTPSIETFKSDLERAAKTSVKPTSTYDVDHAWRETYELVLA